MRNRTITIIVAWGCLLFGSLVSVRAYGEWVARRTQPQTGRYRLHVVHYRVDTGSRQHAVVLEYRIDTVTGTTWRLNRERDRWERHGD